MFEIEPEVSGLQTKPWLKLSVTDSKQSLFIFFLFYWYKKQSTGWRWPNPSSLCSIISNHPTLSILVSRSQIVFIFFSCLFFEVNKVWGLLQRGVKITQEFVIHFTWSTNLHLFLSNVDHWLPLFLHLSPSILSPSLRFMIFMNYAIWVWKVWTLTAVFELCITIGFIYYNFYLLVCEVSNLNFIIRDYIEKSYFWARCPQGIEKWETFMRDSIYNL